MTPFSSYTGAFALILVMDTKAWCEGGGGNPLLNVHERFTLRNLVTVENSSATDNFFPYSLGLSSFICVYLP